MEITEVKAVIKDCIFESVMMGNDLKTTLQHLHFVNGFEKQDIIEAYNEMVDELEEE